MGRIRSIPPHRSPIRGTLGEADKKKMELGDQMEHAQGRQRESLQRDIRALDSKS